MKKLIKIGMKDVIRNYYFLFALAFINILYIFLWNTPFVDEVIWKYEAFYVIVIALLIPLVMHCRYGDIQREIIKEIIYSKIEKCFFYNFFYLLETVLFAAVGIVSASIVILITADASLLREILFIVHIIMTCCIFIMLYINLIYIISKYLLASAIYLIFVFVLVLINAPESYLWFNYGMLRNQGLHWLGKSIILGSLSIMFGVIIYLRKKGKKI